MIEYADLPMDLADASLVLLAEELGHGRIVSTDGYPLKTGQSACVDIAVGWANGSIVNPTLMPRISWVA